MDKIISEKDAVKEMKSIGVMKAGIDIMKDKCAYRLIMLNDVKCFAASLAKEEMLGVGGDVAVSKWTLKRENPTTDVLLMGTLIQYKSFIKKMNLQPMLSTRDIAKRVKKILKL